MRRVRQLAYIFDSTIPRAQSFITIVTSASDVPMRTYS